MKKLNNKGFVLTETLIVATMLITVLMVLYIQFKNVNSSFEETFKYNTVGDSYSLNNAKKYIEANNYSLIAEKLKSVNYVDLTSCSNVYFTETDYCETLFSKLKIKQIIMTNENIYSLIQSNDLGTEFNKFLPQIDYEKGDGYRLIAEFTDETFSSIKILNGERYNYVISNACNASTMVGYSINHVYKNLATDTNTFTLYDPSTGSSSCGSSVDVTSYARTDDVCYTINAYSVPNFELQLDPSKNTATITYLRNEAKLKIYHYDISDNTSIATETEVSSYCGLSIGTEQYRKVISGYTFVKAEKDEVTLSNGETSVILYYRKD